MESNMEPKDSESIQYENLGSAELDKLVEETLKEFRTPGMAVLVVHGDKSFAKGYGLADLENDINVTPKTLFQTGSTTKSFTASVAAHLVESPDFPSISWTTPLADLIPDEFVVDQSTSAGIWATKRITLEDALSHRTGMSRHDMIWINGDPTTEDIVRSLRHLPLHTELRMKYEYCNIMYTAVSHAVETVLEQPFKHLLKQHIFDPLGMNQTSYTVSDALDLTRQYTDVNLARSYLWDEKEEKYQHLPFTDIAPSKGSGGLISNVLDFSHWVRHLMQPTCLNHALSENAVKGIRMPRCIVDPDPRKPYVGPQAYGLGLYSRVYRGRETVQHSGASSGHMATMVMVPRTAKPTESSDCGQNADWAVVVMQNTWSLGQDIVAWHLLDKFLETPERERFDLAGAARKAKREKEDTMKEEKIFNRLFASLDLDRSVKPTLPLERYEGVYRHFVYHEFRVSRLPSTEPDPSKVSQATAENDSPNSTYGRAQMAFSLKPSGSQKSYGSLSAILHHVSGNWFWALRLFGPGCWMTDEALKVCFVVGNDGMLQGMRLQIEPAMPSFLAFFEKVS